MSASFPSLENSAARFSNDWKMEDAWKKGGVIAIGRFAVLLLIFGGAWQARAVTNWLAAVSPSSASQGMAGLVVTFTLGATPPPPPTNVPPSSATIGTFAGVSLAHPVSNLVTGVFSIPAGAPTGACNVQIVFPPGSFHAIGTGLFTVTAGAAAGATGTTNVGAYRIADTGQTNCYNESAVIPPPATGQPFHGQDAQLFGNQPAYRDHGDGTVSDLNTGLMWVQARGTQLAWAAAVANASNCSAGGHADWRMPTMKELYSLVKFSGANGSSLTNAAGYLPFLDTNAFGFAYGGTSTNTGSRIIDAQDWSADYCVSTVMGGQAAAFGYNFTDGRIKGYPPANGNYVRYVRGTPDYGLNHFTNHGDGTVSDLATGLMWPQNDSGAGMSWSNALAWVQGCNATNLLGHADWRLPNAKELHSLLDYSRSPDTTDSAAIFTNFTCTAITNEAGRLDFPWYWTGSTLVEGPNSAGGVYLCFGRAMARMNGAWVDAHGAGAQRSDPKGGSLTNNPKYTYVSNGYYSANAPQGDAVRILNFVRPVRGGFASGLDSVGDGIPDGWRRQYFGGSGTTTDSVSCASGDADGDGMSTLQEYFADTDPTNGASRLVITFVSAQPEGTQFAWTGGTGVTQVLESRADLADTDEPWHALWTNLPPSAISNSWWYAGPASGRFFRLKAGR